MIRPFGKRLTVAEAAVKENCPYTESTIRDFIAKGALRRIMVEGGEGEYEKTGSKIRIVESAFDLWLRRRTYPGTMAEEYGVTMANKGRKAKKGIHFS